MDGLVGGEDGDLDLNSGLERDGGDLLNDLGRRVKVDEALVDAHLKVVPGLGTLTTGRLAGGVGKHLGREADGALNAELLVLRAVYEVGANLLEVLDVTRGKRDADLVDLGSRGRSIHILVLGDIRHLESV